VEKGEGRIGLAAGQRVGRKDTGFKKIQSRVANGVRNAILRDGTRDTGFTAATKPRHTTPARLTNAPPIKRGTPGRERSPSWLDRETS